MIESNLGPQFSIIPSLDVELFFILFPLQLSLSFYFKSHTYLPSSSLEPLEKFYKMNKWSFCLYSLSSCNQVISMELVLCISSGGKKKPNHSIQSYVLNALCLRWAVRTTLSQILMFRTIWTFLIRSSLIRNFLVASIIGLLLACGTARS